MSENALEVRPVELLGITNMKPKSNSKTVGNIRGVRSERRAKLRLKTTAVGVSPTPPITSGHSQTAGVMGGRGSEASIGFRARDNPHNHKAGAVTTAACDGSGKVLNTHASSGSKDTTDFCMGIGCEKYLGHRGFCSQECHDSYYDGSLHDEVCCCKIIGEKTYKELRELEDWINNNLDESIGLNAPLDGYYAFGIKQILLQADRRGYERGRELAIREAISEVDKMPAYSVKIGQYWVTVVKQWDAKDVIKELHNRR